MSLERHNEISPAAELHSSTVFNEVFAQMQAAVSVKAKKVPSDFIQFTNIFAAANSTSNNENGMKTGIADATQITIDSDGSILFGQSNSLAN
ncbi:MAG: hypothetical protein C0508_18535 [Cyanobacteria bacterium PR.023]|nr:hypothetical protein [Cyanobacteria bacterium PR.023]